VIAGAIDDGDQFARRSGLRPERAGGVDRRVRALWSNQLRGGDDGNEDNGNDERDLRASSRHELPSIPEALRPASATIHGDAEKCRRREA
jgi:hypothetical protein